MLHSPTFSECITVGAFEHLLKYNGQDFELAYVNKPIGNRRRVDPSLVFYGDEDELRVDDPEANSLKIISLRLYRLDSV